MVRAINGPSHPVVMLQIQRSRECRVDRSKELSSYAVPTCGPGQASPTKGLALSIP